VCRWHSTACRAAPVNSSPEAAKLLHDQREGATGPALPGGRCQIAAKNEWAVQDLNL
jgi:hypothetical protein